MYEWKCRRYYYCTHFCCMLKLNILCKRQIIMLNTRMAIYVAVVIVFVRFALFIGFCWLLNLVYRQSAYVVRCMQYVKNLRWQFSQQFYHFIIISTTMRLNGGNAECFSQNPRFFHLLNFLVLPALPLSSSLWMCGCVPFSILHYFFFLENWNPNNRRQDISMSFKQIIRLQSEDELDENERLSLFLI